MLLDLRAQETGQADRASPRACNRRHCGADQRRQLSHVDSNRKERKAMELKKKIIIGLGIALVLIIGLPVALVLLAAFGRLA